jgi:hypothetical protein
VTLLASAIAVVGIGGYVVYQDGGLRDRSAAKVESINTFSWQNRQSCRFISGQESPNDFCNLGSSEQRAPSVALIGDSYSNSYSMMMQAYEEVEPKAPAFIQMALGQCPSLLNFGPPVCQKMTNAIYAYIQSHSNINTVILANNWTLYANGFNYPGLSESAASFKSKLENTITAYQKMGKKVVVFLPPPQGSDPKSCVARSVRIGSMGKADNVQNCNLPLAKALQQEGNFRQIILPILAKMQVPIFDPFVYFCNATECKIIDGEKILSLDGGHMSRYGTQFLVEHGKPAIDALLLNK